MPNDSLFHGLMLPYPRCANQRERKSWRDGRSVGRTSGFVLMGNRKLLGQILNFLFADDTASDTGSLSTASPALGKRAGEDIAKPKC